MEYLKSGGKFLWSTVKCSWPALAFVLLDVTDIWTRYLRPELPGTWREISLPGWLIWTVVGLVVVGAAVWTYHRLRMDYEALESARELCLWPINYDRVDGENEWPVFEVAYLWHGFDPPPVNQFIQNRDEGLELREIELTFDRLWTDLTDADDPLTPVSKDIRVGTYFYLLNRDDLRSYCERKGERPAFLFPEER